MVWACLLFKCSFSLWTYSYNGSETGAVKVVSNFAIVEALYPGLKIAFLEKCS